MSLSNKNINYNYMLSFLSKPSSGSNPFAFSSKLNQKFIYPKEDSIIYKEEKLVRCPICLASVLSPVRLNCCFHIYCKICIEKWKKNNNKCPLCKRLFKSLIKINLNEDWVEDQAELFA